MPSSTTTPYVCRQEWPSCICGNSAAALTKVDGQRAPRRCSGRRRASDHPRPTLHAGPPAASTRAATEVSRYPLGARDSSNTSEGPRFLKVRNALGKFISASQADYILRGSYRQGNIRASFKSYTLLPALHLNDHRLHLHPHPHPPAFVRAPCALSLHCPQPCQRDPCAQRHPTAVGSGTRQRQRRRCSDCARR